MKLLCLACGNYLYFETEITTVKEISSAAGQIVIANARFPDFDYTETSLRDNLKDIVDYVLKQEDSALAFDRETESYYNKFISCARCGSPHVTRPCQPPPRRISLDQELDENRKEFKALRKERRDDENTLPQVWQP